jgi:hypothetical protein
LDWEHATVSLTEKGYGEEVGFWYGYDPRSFEWRGTHSLDTLPRRQTRAENVQRRAYSRRLFDGQKPDDETFEKMGNEGINAERQYSEDAIVVWPRSKTWIVLLGNDLEKMNSYLLKNCNEMEGSS